MSIQKRGNRLVAPANKPKKEIDYGDELRNYSGDSISADCLVPFATAAGDRIRII